MAAVRSVFWLISIASEGNGAAPRHPAVPSMPPGQPAKVRLVALETSAFQGGPGGVALGSALNRMKFSEIERDPPESISSVPSTDAEAVGMAGIITTRIARPNLQVTVNPDSRAELF